MVVDAVKKKIADVVRRILVNERVRGNNINDFIVSVTIEAVKPSSVS